MSDLRDRLAELMDLGALVTLAAVPTVAQLTSTTILGSIASVRAGKAVGWSYIAGLTVARLIQGAVGLGAIAAAVSWLEGLTDLERYGDLSSPGSGCCCRDAARSTARVRGF